MMKKLRFSVLVVTLSLLLLPAAGLGAGPRYYFQDIGGFGQAIDINDSGQIILDVRRLYTPPKTWTTIGYSGQPSALNNAGQVVGYTWDTGVGQWAFLWTINQGFQPLAGYDPNGTYISAANGINNLGQSVGVGIFPGKNPMPVRWDGVNSITDLSKYSAGLPDPMESGGAITINDAGDIICEIMITGQGMRGALFTSDKWVIFKGLYPDGGPSNPKSINNKGEVVGASPTLASGADAHAFHWADGTMRDLGTLPDLNTSEALHINEAGQIVGTSYQTVDPYNNYSDWTAVIWTAAGIQDLNKLVVNLPSKAVLRRAWAINNQGQIVGEFNDGNQRPFLLTPLPAAARPVLDFLLSD